MLAILGAVIAMVGALAAWKGLRGTVRRAPPACRRCRYSLEAAGDPARCPECGAHLVSSKDVVTQVRTRDRRLAGAGAVGLLFGVACLAPALLQSAGVRWVRWAPTGALVRLTWLDPALADEVTARAQADPALQRALVKAAFASPGSAAGYERLAGLIRAHAVDADVAREIAERLAAERRLEGAWTGLFPMLLLEYSVPEAVVADYLRPRVSAELHVQAIDIYAYDVVPAIVTTKVTGVPDGWVEVTLPDLVLEGGTDMRKKWDLGGPTYLWFVRVDAPEVRLTARVPFAVRGRGGRFGGVPTQRLYMATVEVGAAFKSRWEYRTTARQYLAGRLAEIAVVSREGGGMRVNPIDWDWDSEWGPDGAPTRRPSGERNEDRGRRPVIRAAGEGGDDPAGRWDVRVSFELLRAEGEGWAPVSAHSAWFGVWNALLLSDLRAGPAAFGPAEITPAPAGRPRPAFRIRVTQPEWASGTTVDLRDLTLGGE